MHEFKYKNNQLYCEEAKVQDLAEKFGTPLYIYSYHTLISHFIKLKTALDAIEPLICYSVKANSNLAILKAPTSIPTLEEFSACKKIYKLATQ